MMDNADLCRELRGNHRVDIIYSKLLFSNFWSTSTVQLNEVSWDAEKLQNALFLVTLCEFYNEMHIQNMNNIILNIQ